MVSPGPGVRRPDQASRPAWGGSRGGCGRCGRGAAGRGGTGGFSLVEALIALVLSSVVMILVSTTFLVQNRAQARQAAMARAHEDARASAEAVASALRSTMDDGIVVAGAATLTVRSPVTVAVVCARSPGPIAPLVHVHVAGGAGDIDTDEIAGAALFDPGSGLWSYEYETWSFFDAGNAQSAARCADQGTDTTGIATDFHTVFGLFQLFGLGATPEVGERVMFFRETTFSIAPSALEPALLALRRTPRGQQGVELASGLDTTSAFAYRVGSGPYQDTVSAGGVGDVDAVRVAIGARRPSGAPGDGPVTFEWVANVALRNVP